MHPQTTFRTLGQLLTLFSFTMVPPLIISWYTQDGSAKAFIYAFIATVISGVSVWALFIQAKKSMSIRDGLMLTALFWIMLSLFGAIPFYFSEPRLSIADAVFESFSGFTTTGATVIEHIEGLPPSIKMYRQMLQWLGGMGIVILAVAILPMLGVNSVLLYKTETPGPNKNARIAPRIANTAKILWFIYLGFTLACALSYKLAGMSWFDAIGHSFTTVAIGGFSTHDASFGYFDSFAIELICVFFMILSAINFSLHFTAWNSKKLGFYWKDPEVRFLVCALIIGIFSAAFILAQNSDHEFPRAFRLALFNVTSLATTTGYATDNFSIWPLSIPTMMIVLSCIGGCAGSTCGGVKAVRIFLLLKLTSRELKRVLHPNGVFTIRLFGKQIPSRTIEGIWGFFVAYILLFIVIMLGLESFGVDSQTAWSATLATLNNLGPGLGEVSANYSGLPDNAKWLLCLSMLLGRLEIFTLLAFISPLMWRG